MADVLGWPERQPLVAVSDRPRVLTSWGPYCGGIVPLQRYIPFAAVRQLSPNDFVKVLALNLKVAHCDLVLPPVLHLKRAKAPFMHLAK